MKKCKRCAEIKDLSEFYFHKSRNGRANRYGSNCILCEKAIYREKHPKPINQYLAQDGTKRCRDCDSTMPVREFSVNRATKDGLQIYCRSCVKLRNQTPGVLYSTYKCSAKRRNHDFRLSKSQFMDFWQQPCHYCGDAIDTIGLDRVNTSLGYVIGNVVSCCITCNRMKMDHSVTDWLAHIQKVLNYMS